MKFFFILLVLLPVPALAQQAPGMAGFGKNWEEADTDQDGRISRQEYLSLTQQRAERSFAGIDANGDGAIEAGELTAFYEAQGQTNRQALEKFTKNNPAAGQ